MRGLGIIAGILLSILGGYAFFMEIDMFVRLGWLLGIVFMINGAVLIVPAIQEKIKAKKKAAEPEPPVRRKKKKQPEQPKKKDYTNNILGGISIGVGFIIFLSGITKTLTDISLVYLVGSCVMFYGVIQLSVLTKEPKEEESKPAKKKKKANVEAEEKQEGKTTTIVCCVISLVIGALAVCHSFMDIMSIDKLVSYNLVMQGVNCVVAALNVHKKQ